MKLLSGLALFLLSVGLYAAPPDSGKLKAFGSQFGIDAHPVPPDWANVFSWGYGGDLGDWYQYEPTQGNFQSAYIGHELQILATAQGQFEIQTLIWGSRGGNPAFNEPAWLVPLSAAQQKAEYIKALQWLDSDIPQGSRVNVLQESLHTDMSTVVQSLGGPGATGFDGFIAAIKLARQYMPHQLIGVQDYNLLTNDNQPWDPGFVTRFIAFIQILQANGASPDYIAEEGSFLEAISATDIQTSLQRIFSATHLPIEVAQLEINQGTTDSDQLSAWQRIFPAIWNSPVVYRVGSWNTDPASWTGYQGHDNDFLWRSDESHRPALDWVISYIAASNPPNVVGGPNPPGVTTPIPTPTPSVSPSPTPSPSSTPTPTPVPTATPSPVPTPTPPPPGTTYNAWQHWLERQLINLIETNPPVPDSP